MLPWSAQLELVRALWTYPEVQRELGTVLKPSHFENPALGWITSILVGLWEQGSSPTEGQVRNELAKLQPQMEASCLALLADVTEASLPMATWAIEEGRFFAAYQEAMILTGEIPTLAKAREWVQIKQRSDDLYLLSSVGGDMFSGLKDKQELIDRQVRVGRSIPTGIKRVDLASNGGLERGQVGHVLAKKGGGKSHALVSLGAYAALLGYRVHHATYENSVGQTRARYDRSFTGLSDQQIVNQADNLLEDLQGLHGRLTVVDLRTKGSTVRSIYTSLDKIPSGQKPDLVIVDYLQKIRKVGGGINADTRRRDLVSASEEVEALAVERDVALWTAWQANRSGIMKMRNKRLQEQGLLDISDYAECIEASYPAAIILSLNKNLTEEGTPWGKIHLCENRDGEAGVTIEALMDWSISRVRDQLS